MAVAIGALISAFWILAANSWMQTPAGYSVNEAGQFVPEDWLAIIFNPSFPYRLVHMVLAAYLATAFLVGAAGAWHLLNGRHGAMTRTMFSMAMWMAALVTPLQVIAGDLHGLNTFEHQPAKVAAMEGHFEAEQRGAPLVLFGLPDMQAGEMRYAVTVPKLGSLILTHELDGTVRGLKSWPREDWPRVPIVFWSFRVMVGLGLLMLATGLAGLWLRHRGRLYDSRLFARWCLAMGPSGFVALLAGWFVTETGRQPYTVYGLLRTEDSVSPIASLGVAGSLLAFVARVSRRVRRRHLVPAAADGGEPGCAPGRTARHADPCRRHHADPGHPRRRSGAMSAALDLAVVWSVILAFAVFAYVVLDGFDLGIGILAPFSRSDEEEEIAIASIAPVWDGNETWLVLGGGGMMAAFPLAYSVLLPALYAPLIAMLLALIFRGVAFEFRHRNVGASQILDLGLHPRLLRRHLRARRRAGHLHPGHRGRGPRL